MNFSKKSSLFGSGKRPLVCRGSALGAAGGASKGPPGQDGSAGGELTPSGGSSLVDERASGSAEAFTWQRSGLNIAYYPSPYRGRTSGSAEALRKTKKVWRWRGYL